MDLNPEATRLRYDEFALSNIHRIISIWECKVSYIIQAIQVCFVIEWGPLMRATIGVTLINRLLIRERDSTVAKKAYRKFIRRAHFPPDPSGIPPYDLEPWMRIVVKFALYRE